ncbi:MAG: hypothetical protein AB7Q00_06310 [Phycisphaerales bacterium]
MSHSRLIASWVAAAVIALLAAASPSIAQRRLEVDITRVDWGVAGKRAVSLEWTPIVVHVRSMRGPVSGLMTVTAKQDDLHEVAVSTGFSATMADDTPIEIAIPLSWGLSSVGITFEADNPWRRRTFEFTTVSNALTGPGPRALPVFVGQRQPSVWVVEDVRLGEKEAETSAPRNGYVGTPNPKPQPVADDEKAALASAAVVRVEPGSMPTSWIVYRGADVVVVRGDLGTKDEDRASNESIRALMDWVHSGGSLFVVVDGAGTEWRRFVEPPQNSASAPPVEALESTPVATPDRIAKAVERWNAFARKKSSDATSVEISSTIRVRALRLTDAGRRLGWTLDDDAVLESLEASGVRTGAVATGPVGLGMVTLVGCDPTDVPRIVHSGASAMVWDALLSPTLDHLWKGLNDARESGNWYWDSYSPRASSDIRSAQAIVNCLESVSVIPPVGHGTFLTLGLVVLALGLLLGPGDMLWLRFMKWRQHWWITALGWIVLATLGAWYLPRIVRAAPSAMFRLTQEDAIVDESGNTLVWRDGVTGVFAGRYLQMNIEDSQAGTWWRPVQPEVMTWRDPDQSGKGRRVVQLDHLRPSPGSPRQCALVPFAIPQWTARTFVDSAPSGTTSLPVKFELNSSNGDQTGPMVVVKTRPGWTITQPPALEVENAWITFASTTPIENGEGLIYTKPSKSTSPPPTSGMNRQNNDYAYMNLGTVTSTDLIGPRERSQAIDAMIHSGHWGVMHLTIVGDTDGVAIAGQSATRVERINMKTTRSLRVLLPLSEEFKAALGLPSIESVDKRDTGTSPKPEWITSPAAGTPGAVGESGANEP